MATRAKRPKRVIRRKKKAPPVEAPPPAPQPPLEDPSLAEMRAVAARQDAQRRVAAFMERTSKQPWMRERMSSFELALIGGLRNLLVEAHQDEKNGRCDESLAAHYTFVYGLMTSIRHLFFWLALEARIGDTSVRLGRAPEDADAERIMRELEVFNSAAARDDAQHRFRQMLSPQAEIEETRKRVMEQARAFDLLTSLKDMPKA